MKKFILLCTVAAMLFLVACGNNDGYENGADTPSIGADTPGTPVTPDNIVIDINVDDDNNDIADLPSPGATISAFIGYLVAGNYDAAAVLHPGGLVSALADISEEFGTSFFQLLSYSNVNYTIDGNNATVTFNLTNVDLGYAMFEAEVILGEAGLVDIFDPYFDEEEFDIMVMEVFAEMLDDGTAPTFEDTYTLQLQFAGGIWLIAEDMTFGLALMGV